jgi:hypothetical protein
MRYAHLAPSDLQKAVSALSRVASAPVAQAKAKAPRRNGTREAQALPGHERDTG